MQENLFSSTTEDKIARKLGFCKQHKFKIIIGTISVILCSILIIMLISKGHNGHPHPDSKFVSADTMIANFGIEPNWNKF